MEDRYKVNKVNKLNSITWAIFDREEESGKALCYCDSATTAEFVCLVLNVQDSAARVLEAKAQTSGLR